MTNKLFKNEDERKLFEDYLKMYKDYYPVSKAINLAYHEMKTFMLAIEVYEKYRQN